MAAGIIFSDKLVAIILTRESMQTVAEEQKRLMVFRKMQHAYPQKIHFVKPWWFFGRLKTILSVYSRRFSGKSCPETK